MEPILKYNVVKDASVIYDYLNMLPIEYRKDYFDKKCNSRAVATKIALDSNSIY